MSKITGSYTGEFECNDLSIEYTVSVKGDYYYSPGRMYMSNGDPGYPDEESIDDTEVTDIDEYHVYKDGEELTEEQLAKYKDTIDFDTLITRDAEANEDDWNWNDPEPDFDDMYDELDNYDDYDDDDVFELEDDEEEPEEEEDDEELE